MVKLKQLKPDPKFYRGWGFVGLCAVALTVAVFITRGGWDAVQAGVEAKGCRVQVTAEEVRVRTAPEPTAAVIDLLRKGQVKPAQSEVRNGFRKLEEGRWAAEQFLRPTDC